MDISAIKTIASHELMINVRNKWTVLFGIMFGFLALLISYFGLITEAVVGFQGFTRTSASLLNLVLYLVPIISLAMSTLSYSSEIDSGEMLFSQPVARTEILIGKLVGLLVSVSGSTLIGFGAAGFLISAQVGIDGLSRYLAFVGYALLLECSFLSLGAAIAILSGTKAQAFGYSLFVWFFFVLFYDLLVMGTTFLLNERAGNRFIFVSLFGNPVDLTRVGSLMVLGDPAIFGYAGAALVKFLGGYALSNFVLISGLIIWTIVPVAVVSLILQKHDI